jgi:hypothetical protein
VTAAYAEGLLLQVLPAVAHAATSGEPIIADDAAYVEAAAV